MRITDNMVDRAMWNLSTLVTSFSAAANVMNGNLGMAAVSAVACGVSIAMADPFPKARKLGL